MEVDPKVMQEIINLLRDMESLAGWWEEDYEGAREEMENILEAGADLYQSHYMNYN